MDEQARRGYLQALGVNLWVPRASEPAENPPRPQAPVAAQSDRPTSEPTPNHRAAANAGGVAAMDWDALRAAVRECRTCGLCETRTQTVFGVGNRNAELLIVGEAPGLEEDRRGEPFVGRAGQLLDRMLAAIGLSRDQVYIANILKCRPPGNRDPQPEEALSCEPFLARQIELINPRLVLATGRISSQNLLRTDASVGRLRGRWFALGAARIPLRVTYHPAYLLRAPEHKAKAWEDLVEVAGRLHGDGDGLDSIEN